MCGYNGVKIQRYFKTQYCQFKKRNFTREGTVLFIYHEALFRKICNIKVELGELSNKIMDYFKSNLI